MPYPFVPGETLGAVELNAALDMRMLTSGTNLAFTPGACLFGSTAGGFQTDSTNYFWDDTNNRLGIRTNTPQVMLQVGKVAATARTYNSYTDTANGAWAYLGDWGKTAGVAVYGSDKNGSGLVADVSIVRGGTEVLRLGASGITATGGIVHVQPVPVLLGTAALAGTQRSCTVMGHYAYVTNGAATPTDTLEIFDITNPLLPVKVGGLPFPATAVGNSVVVAGHILYSGCNFATGGLQVVDVSNPKLPVLMSSLSVGGQSLQALAISGGYLYMGHTTGTTFRLYDIGNPSAPSFKSNATLPGANAVRGIVLQGKYAYVSTGQAVAGTGGFYVVDVSDVLNPVVVSSTYALQSGGFPIGMAAFGKYLYLCSGSQALVEIINIEDPANPVFVKNFATAGPNANAPHPIIAGDYLYICSNSASGLQVFNIADPLNPVSIGSAVAASPQGAFLSGNRLYLASNSQLRIYNTFGVDASSVRAGALATDSLNVDGASYFAGDMYAQRGLIVGPSGIHSRGPLMVDASEAAIPITAILGAGLVCFAGQGATAPALKRSGTTLQVRLADDSAYAGLTASALIVDANAGTLTARDTRTVATGNGGTVAFQAGNQFAAQVTMGSINGYMTDATAGSEDGSIQFRTMQNGTLTAQMAIGAVGTGSGSGMLIFGPAITNVYPALKRNPVSVQQLDVRYGDDSGFAPFACGWLGANGTSPGTALDIQGSSNQAVVFNLTPTMTSVTTNPQFCGYIQPTFAPTGASLQNSIGIGVFVKQSGSIPINDASGVNIRAADLTAYTGARLTYSEGLFINEITGGTAIKCSLNNRAILIDPQSNGNGSTTGTVTNVGLYYAGATAGAGAGGTVANHGSYIALPSGAGAGITGNYGIFITGNGGSGGGGSINNVALYSDSTAQSVMQSFRIGAPAGTANPTNATAPFLSCTVSAGTPTGVPSYTNVGSAQIQWDSTNKKLWVFDPVAFGWKGVVLA